MALNGENFARQKVKREERFTQSRECREDISRVQGAEMKFVQRDSTLSTCLRENRRVPSTLSIMKSMLNMKETSDTHGIARVRKH